MTITHALQQKVIAKYKDIIEHQVTIIEAQQQQILKLEKALALQTTSDVFVKNHFSLFKEKMSEFIKSFY